jgi:hypothetical protein
MPTDLRSTTPKPFIFVLMPFSHDFNDIYKFGIKGAAEAVDAYAERVDEQMYTEGILDRIYNQINKADVIIADMTGQNPNVFYEVGYAHALGKIVLLLTQEANDIPFDLKHRPHIVYGGSIDSLKTELVGRLRWAITESKKQKSQVSDERYEVNIAGVNIPETSTIEGAPIIEFQVQTPWHFPIKVFIRNNSMEASASIEYIYFFTKDYSGLVPWFLDRVEGEGKFMEPFMSSAPSHSELNKQYRLFAKLPPLPPGAVDDFEFIVGFPEGDYEESNLKGHNLALRVHSHTNVHDFPFVLKVTAKKY